MYGYKEAYSEEEVFYVLKHWESQLLSPSYIYGGSQLGSLPNGTTSCIKCWQCERGCNSVDGNEEGEEWSLATLRVARKGSVAMREMPQQ